MRWNQMIERRDEHPGPDTLDRTLSAPGCVQCGVRISTIRDDCRNEGTCPECGCDFRIREPMSYARMEGFLIPEPEKNPEFEPGACRESWADAMQTRLTERWILTIVLGLVLTLLVLELSLG